MTPTTIDLAERMKIIGARMREGRDTYAGKEDAWHLMGDVWGKFMTWKEAVASNKSGVGFEVIKAQLEFRGQPVDAYGTFRIDPAIPKGLEKEPVRAVEVNGVTYYLNFLATVGKDYEVIQHTEGFEMLDAFVGQIDGAHYATLGTLDFGRTVWGQIDPNLTIKVGEDMIKAYLTLHTSHDATRGLGIFLNGIREVCRNTFRMGDMKRLSSTVRVRHTKNAHKRIEDMKLELVELHKLATTMEEKLNYLATRRMTRESFTTIFDRLFPKTKNDDGVEASSSRRENILAGILERYEYNDGNAFPEQRGTSYNFFNSVVEYTDHMRGSNPQSRALSATFGSGDKLKSSALDLILGEAEKMPLMREAQKGILVDWNDAGITLPKATN